MTTDTVIALSVLGVVGQVLVGLGLIIGALALVGVRGPLDALRNLLWGYELWAADVRMMRLYMERRESAG